ncbi:hypothetical protein [Janthinobacterium sp.]|uniref:hypothetical protein n=1 Tax=Janthinobacterium sp. TaxID=1871054 RepID=UPI0026180B10|nr:hypothetical protein [Janthinobacterium sp.]
MEVTAILEREGDWATLQGWVNHTSGELVSPSRGDWIFQLVAAFLLASWVSIAWCQFSPLLLFLLYGMSCAWMLRRAYRVRAALEAVLENRTTAR